MNAHFTYMKYGNIRVYRSVLRDLHRDLPHWQGPISLVAALVDGLVEYQRLFSLQRYEALIRLIRAEHEYSRHVTIIARELMTTIRNPQLSLSEINCLQVLVSTCHQCLRAAIELFVEAEAHMINSGIRIPLNADDAFEEYERAQASVWEFQRDFHLYQIDASRGDARAFVFVRSFNYHKGSVSDAGSAGSPMKLDSPSEMRSISSADGSDISMPDWREPDEEYSPLTESEVRELAKLMNKLNRLNPQTNLPRKRAHEETFEFPDVTHLQGILRKSNDHRSRATSAASVRTKKRVKFAIPQPSPDSASPSEAQPQASPRDEVAGNPETGKISFLPTASSPKQASEPAVVPEPSETPRTASPTQEIMNTPEPPSSPALDVRDAQASSPLASPKVDTELSRDCTSAPVPEEEEKNVPENPQQPMESDDNFAPDLSLSTQAYLGLRHDEYSVGMAAEPGSPSAGAGHGVQEERSQEFAVRSKASVTTSALLHWAQVTREKRAQRIVGRERLRRAMDIGASTKSLSLRRGLFTPLGPPNLPSQSAQNPAAFRRATLDNLSRFQPRIDLTLEAFTFNEEALRLYGGLVGKAPSVRDLENMDAILRELEGYIQACLHRRGLIVDLFKRKRVFPFVTPAQFADLVAAHDIAEDNKRAAARRCFEYVAPLSTSPKYGRTKVMRTAREFNGRLSPRDHEKLRALSGTDGEAERLLAELQSAQDWQTWCQDMIDRWTTQNWRPEMVEKKMIYVDEDMHRDVTRYKHEINIRRANRGLTPVERPQDEVYERQQGRMRMLDVLWKLVT